MLAIICVCALLSSFQSGTGATAIYALLGVKIWSGLRMTATGACQYLKPSTAGLNFFLEIDPLSLEFAQRNISQNQLSNRIKLVRPKGSELFDSAAFSEGQT